MDPISYSYFDALMTNDDEVFFKLLGKRIAVLRKEGGLTQVQLADSLNISQQHMASIEVGRRKATASNVSVLAKIFATSTDALLGLQDKPVKRGPVSKLQQQIDRVSRLPRAKQKFVIEMIDTVIQQQASG